MKFEYFRFLLSPLKEPKLPFNGDKTRAALLNEFFSEGRKYSFKNRNVSFGMRIDRCAEGLVVARIGKKTKKQITLSHEADFETKELEDWPASMVFLNLNDEKATNRMTSSGQVIAFEVNPVAIPTPRTCLNALADKLNEDLEFSGYHLTINPIPADRRQFWPIMRQYKGNIRKVVFSYTPPNLFDINSNLEDDLKKTNQSFNTTNVKIELENETGDLELPEDNQLLNETAGYLDLGGGTFKLHLADGKKTIITSAEGVKTEKFEGVDAFFSAEGASTEGVLAAVREVLGMKKDD